MQIYDQEKPSDDELEKKARCLEKDRQKRLQAEKSLRVSEALFQGVFDHMTSGCAIYEVVNDGNSGRDYIVKNFNAASLRIEGKNPGPGCGQEPL